MSEVPIPLDDFTALTEDGGVLKNVIKPGKLDLSPVAGDDVVIIYSTKLIGENKDQQYVHSLINKKEKLTFRFGQPVVMEGWNITIPTMKMGESCQIYVTSMYAFNDGNSYLIDLELVDFYGDDVNLSNVDSVFLTRIERGNAGTPVRPGATCGLTIKEYTNEKFIGERQITKYIVGDHACNGLPKGFDFGLSRMDAGEKGRIKVAKNLVYPKEWYEEHDVPIGSPIYFLVEVTSCEQRKTPSAFKSFNQKLENMKSWKDRANEFIKEGKHTIALDMYQDLLDDIPSIITTSFKENDLLLSFKCTLYQNRALAYLKLKCPDQCLKECDKAIGLFDNNEKCLYRKGEAYLLMNDHEEAQKWFEEVLKVNPSNAAAVARVKSCKAVISDQLKKESRMFLSAFKQMSVLKDDTVDKTIGAQ
nr:peptidyl prolyl cis trans isomerase FKBP4 [Hymenolepis microstoma]